MRGNVYEQMATGEGYEDHPDVEHETHEFSEVAEVQRRNASNDYRSVLATQPPLAVWAAVTLALALLEMRRDAAGQAKAEAEHAAGAAYAAGAASYAVDTLTLGSSDDSFLKRPHAAMAASYAQQLIEATPADFAPRCLKAEALWRLGDLDAALEEAERACAINTSPPATHAAPYLLRGRLLHAMHRYLRIPAVNS